MNGADKLFTGQILNTNTMQAKTLPTIGRLQVGDRFYFTGAKKEVQELLRFDAKTAVYSMVMNGKALLSPCINYTRVNREVIFLRHTKLATDSAACFTNFLNHFKT